MSADLPDDLKSLWREIAKPAGVWRSISVIPWHGIDERVLGGRVDRLTKSKRSAKVLEMLAGKDAATLRRIATLARVNERRAQAGFRATLVVNLSGPVAGIAAVAQIMPDGFASTVQELSADGLLGPFVVAAGVLIVAVVSFSFLRVREASDLVDLVALAGAHSEHGPDADLGESL
jgi:hypothetical protein